jgi:hypothetical protein
MTLKDLLLRPVEFTYEKEGAYPPLRAALAGLSPAQAAWKPDPRRHSIWQIVRHLILWDEAALDALTGRPKAYQELQNADWREAKGDEREWDQDVARLHEVGSRLKERLGGMDDRDLEALIRPYTEAEPYPAAMRFLRTMTHSVYHCGQIRHLRALQGA